MTQIEVRGTVEGVNIFLRELHQSGITVVEVKCTPNDWFLIVYKVPVIP
ncbi:MAG: hypothetical protein LBM95_06680 [Lactobacillales bacterium]|jgi:hypothetical protein|nr:hypothetical protein [Lactobacillales bacterium]